MKKTLSILAACLMLCLGAFACKKKDTPAAPVAPPADTATFTVTPSPTASPTVTQSPTVTSSPTVTATATLTATATVTSTPTAHATQTAMPTVCWILGRNTDGLNTFDVSGGTFAILNSWMVSSSVTVWALGINNGAGNPYDLASDFQLGLYTNAAGEPGIRIVATDHFRPEGFAGNSYRPVTPTVLVPGNYWIAVLVNPGPVIDSNLILYDGVATLSGESMGSTSDYRMFSWVLGNQELPYYFGSMTPCNWNLDLFAYYCP